MNHRTFSTIRQHRLHHSLCVVLFTQILFLTADVNGAEIAPVREYIEEEQRSRLDELLSEYGRHKELPDGFELQALLALSHFPELQDVRIRFIIRDTSIPISSRPLWTTMLRSAKNRTYLIVVDSEREGRSDALLLKNQPFNAQVGIIGHELAHTVYYLNRSFFGIVGDAACQLNRCRIEFERNTDRRLVEYGLGWQRYDHAVFLRRRFTENAEDVFNMEGGGGAYMSPAEIMRLIDINESYAD